MVDDPGSPRNIAQDSRYRLARLPQIWRIGRKPSQAGFGVGHCRSDGLIQFMRQGGTQLTHGAYSVEVSELSLCLAQRFLRALAFGDVAGVDNDSCHSGFAEEIVGPQFDGCQISVGTPEADFNRCPGSLRSAAERLANFG